MRAGNFNPIHCFPHKKNFVNEGVEILLLSIGLVKFIFGIFDNDAGGIEGVELGEDGYFAVALAHADGDASILGGSLPFRVVERYLIETLLFLTDNSLIHFLI